MNAGSKSTTVIAVLAASLAGAAIGTVGFGFMWFPNGLGFWAALAFAATGLWWGIWPALVACLVVGLPAHALIMERTTASLFPYAITGATTATLASLIFVKSPASWVILITAGTISACTFWLVRRPDRRGDAVSGLPTAEVRKVP